MAGPSLNLSYRALMGFNYRRRKTIETGPSRDSEFAQLKLFSLLALGDSVRPQMLTSDGQY